MPRSHENQPARDRRRAATHDLLEELDRATEGQRQELEDALIAANVAVAHDVARRYHGRGIPADDLDQVACVGLVKAVRGYDPAKATDFLGYAVPTIRGELRRHFRDHGWTVRPPRSIQELQPRVTRVRGQLWQRLGHDPRPEEIADELEIDIASVREAMGAEGCFAPTSLDATPDDGVAVAERLATTEAGFPRVEARLSLRPLMRSLSERERRILQMRFFDGRTQAEIGREIGVTQMQVSRLLSRLLGQLREDVGEVEPG